MSVDLGSHLPPRIRTLLSGAAERACSALIALVAIVLMAGEGHAGACTCSNWVEAAPRAQNSCTELLGSARGFTEWGPQDGGTCRVCYEEFAACPTGQIEGSACRSMAGDLTFTDLTSGWIAHYATDNGRIIGERAGAQVDAFWIEDKSAQRCSYPIDGSHNWGRIAGRIEAGRSIWKWNYCEKEPLSRDWWVDCPIETVEIVQGSAVPTGGASDDGPKACSGTFGPFAFSGASAGLLGRYGSDDGRLFGTVAGGSIDGIWVEAGSRERCDTPYDGSYHWGRFAGNLTPSGFDARWSYCDRATDTGREWTCD